MKVVPINKKRDEFVNEVIEKIKKRRFFCVSWDEDNIPNLSNDGELQDGEIIYVCEAIKYYILNKQ